MNEATANRHLAATRPQVDRALHTQNLATAWERIHTRKRRAVRTSRLVTWTLLALASIPFWLEAYRGLEVLRTLLS